VLRQEAARFVLLRALIITAAIVGTAGAKGAPNSRTAATSEPGATEFNRHAQTLRALGQANEVRRRRAALKRGLAAGALTIVDVLADPPAYAATAKVRQLLLALPHLGPVRANRLLLHCQIAEGTTVAGLTDRQRAALSKQLASRTPTENEPNSQ
jgi:hypothetical protein